MGRNIRTIGTEPLGGPVQRTEKGAGRDHRVGGAQDAGADAVGNQRSHAALVAIALGHDPRSQTPRQRVDLEMCGAALDLVQQAAHVRRRQSFEPLGQRRVRPPRLGQRRLEAVERAVLAEEEELVLAAEVVIQVSRRQVGGQGDVAHPGAGEAAGAKHAGGRPQNLDAAGIGAA